MGTLYLVRHGQASLGAANYDQLSELGARQCRQLGTYYRERGVQFDAVLRGSLQRHQQSLAALAEGLGDLPAPLVWPGLNEYDSDAVVRAIHPDPLPPANTPERARDHFRLLRDGLAQWMRGATQPAGMPPYAAFVAGVMGALDHIRQHHVGQRVLIVSSGGPISMAVGQVLATPPETAIDLNLRLRNSAVTEMAFSARRHALLTFNTLAHLDHPDRHGWVTHA